MQNKNFCAFILSHGRPDKVLTYSSLKKHGYSGKIIILIDDQDKKASEYKEKFGNLVVVFDKKKIKNESESGNNFNDYRSTIYPRNAMHQIAKDLGITHYIQLDDDYKEFRFMFDYDLNFTTKHPLIKSLDKIFSIMVDYFESAKLKSLCMSQGGDFVLGCKSSLADSVKIKRKGMNSFICSTERPFKFFGQMNEDVNTAIVLGGRGDLFFTTNQIALEQAPTQQIKGGMTEIYKDSGTYVKSFYSVMYKPCSVKISRLNDRIHHFISWKNVAPYILRENIKKK
jgi:hypothetical protein